MSAARHKVVLYTTPTCGYCRQAKDHLKRHRVPFAEVDVSRDERAAADMRRRSGQSAVPVVLIDGRAIVGFDKSRIDRLLGL